MKKGFVLVVALVAFTFTGIIGCGPSAPDNTKAPAPKADAAKPAAPKAEAPKAEAPKPEAPKPAEPAAAPATPAPATVPASVPPTAPAPAGAAITSDTIVGTTWEAGPYKLSFAADGKLKVNDAIEGTWKIEANKLKIEAAGQSLEAEIQGDKITYNGTPLVKKS